MKQYVVTVNQRTYYVEVETAGEAKTPLAPSKPEMAAWTHPEPPGGYRRYRPSPVQNRRNSL